MFHIVPSASPKDIDLAVTAARNAFKTTWGKNVTGFQRSKLINKLADLIERDAQELAELESLNNGKPVRIARYVSSDQDFFPSYPIEGVKRDFDIGDSVQCLRYYAGWADKISGQVGFPFTKYLFTLWSFRCVSVHLTDPNDPDH